VDLYADRADLVGEFVKPTEAVCVVFRQREYQREGDSCIAEGRQTAPHLAKRSRSSYRRMVFRRTVNAHGHQPREPAKTSGTPCRNQRAVCDHGCREPRI
jgi:hypothetical protein